MTTLQEGPIKGWKCFSEDLSCRDVKFEIGKSYEIRSPPVMCRNGFHFHENATDLFVYYPKSLKTRVCEVTAWGVLTQGDKSVAQRIEVGRELGLIEVCLLRFGDGDGDGDGDGYGYGDGDGYGNGYGYGYGDGDGYGNGYGDGDGDGYGDGDGDGDGDGYGYGEYGPLPDFIRFEEKAA